MTKFDTDLLALNHKLPPAEWFDVFHLSVNKSRTPAQRAAASTLTEEDIYAMVREIKKTLQGK